MRNNLYLTVYFTEGFLTGYLRLRTVFLYEKMNFEVKICIKIQPQSSFDLCEFNKRLFPELHEIKSIKMLYNLALEIPFELNSL